MSIWRCVEQWDGERVARFDGEMVGVALITTCSGTVSGNRKYNSSGVQHGESTHYTISTVNKYNDCKGRDI